jgi:hypothetical protein
MHNDSDIKRKAEVDKTELCIGEGKLVYICAG